MPGTGYPANTLVNQWVLTSTKLSEYLQPYQVSWNWKKSLSLASLYETRGSIAAEQVSRLAQHYISDFLILAWRIQWSEVVEWHLCLDSTKGKSWKTRGISLSPCSWAPVNGKSKHYFQTLFHTCFTIKFVYEVCHFKGLWKVYELEAYENYYPFHTLFLHAIQFVFQA